AYRTLVSAFPEQDEAAAALWRLGWLAWLRGESGDAAATWSKLAGTRAGQGYREAASYWLRRARGTPRRPGRRPRPVAPVEGERGGPGGPAGGPGGGAPGGGRGGAPRGGGGRCPPPRSRGSRAIPTLRASRRCARWACPSSPTRR